MNVASPRREAAGMASLGLVRLRFWNRSPDDRRALETSGCLRRFAIVDRLAALKIGLEPAEHSRPAAVALGKFGIGSEPLMTEPDESTVLFGMELPADRCFHLPRPTREPGVNQKMRPHGSPNTRRKPRSCGLPR